MCFKQGRSNGRIAPPTTESYVNVHFTGKVDVSKNSYGVWAMRMGSHKIQELTEAHPILILKCGQNLCDLALVQYQEVYLWFLNNKLFSVTGSKFANLCDFVAEISIAENIYHGTSTDLANLNLGNLNLGDVHIFSTGSLGKSPIHWSTLDTVELQNK